MDAERHGGADRLRVPPGTRAVVLVASDAALAQPDENRAGPVLAEGLVAVGCQVETVVVGQDTEAVDGALAAAVERAEVVVTVGGTGVRPGDVVVDRTLSLGLVELPGIAEEVRRRGALVAPASLLSRAVAGLVDAPDGRRVVVVNAPSSRGGARDVVAVLHDVLAHLLRDLAGLRRG